jgi:ATP-dependent protease La (LON) substrate-binding domain
MGVSDFRTVSAEETDQSLAHHVVPLVLCPRTVPFPFTMIRFVCGDDGSRAALLRALADDRRVYVVPELPAVEYRMYPLDVQNIHGCIGIVLDYNAVYVEVLLLGRARVIAVQPGHPVCLVDVVGLKEEAIWAEVNEEVLAALELCGPYLTNRLRLNFAECFVRIFRNTPGDIADAIANELPIEFHLKLQLLAMPDVRERLKTIRQIVSQRIDSLELATLPMLKELWRTAACQRLPVTMSDPVIRGWEEQRPSSGRIIIGVLALLGYVCTCSVFFWWWAGTLGLFGVLGGFAFWLGPLAFNFGLHWWTVRQLKGTRSTCASQGSDDTTEPRRNSLRR